MLTSHRICWLHGAQGGAQQETGNIYVLNSYDCLWSDRMATVMAEVTLDDTLKDFEDDNEFLNVIGGCSIFWLVEAHAHLCFGNQTKKMYLNPTLKAQTRRRRDSWKWLVKLK